MRILSTFLLAAVLSSIAAPVYAQQKENTYGDWNVFTIQQQGRKVCYIASAPKNKTGNYSRRDEPYLLVTHISSTVDEVSTSSGYDYKNSSEVALTVEKSPYKMFTKGELAWAYDSKQDAAMVSSMKKGMKLTVKGTSQRGTYSIDTYSLRGFSNAYQRMKVLCR